MKSLGGQHVIRGIVGYEVRTVVSNMSIPSVQPEEESRDYFNIQMYSHKFLETPQICTVSFPQQK